LAWRNFSRFARPRIEGAKAENVGILCSMSKATVMPVREFRDAWQSAAIPRAELWPMRLKKW